MACRKGHISAISSLLSQGVNMTIRNNEDKTPLDVCQDTSKDEIVNVFCMYKPTQGEVYTKTM